MANASNDPKRRVVGLGFLIEIDGLGGRERLGDRRVDALSRY